MQFTAKTVEEAIKNGLTELGLTEEQVTIEVLEQPTKGLFGLLKGKAVVEINEKKEEKQVKEDKKETIDKSSKKSENKAGAKESQETLEFVQKIIDMMELNAVAELTSDKNSTVITLTSNDSSSVIGYRGEVLDAIQTLAGASMNIGKEEYKKVVVDCENYRGKREETLISLAHKLADKATEMRREVILEPMSPYERRIIHTALADSTTCTTKSDGKEPNRYVVIVPNDKDEFSTPYNAGRKHGDKGGKQRKDNRNKKGGFKSRSTNGAKKSGFVEQKRKTPSSFGTYLGNSLKK